MFNNTLITKKKENCILNFNFPLLSVKWKIWNHNIVEQLGVLRQILQLNIILVLVSFTYCRRLEKKN